MIGTALGTAVAGALFGPALGALAADVGTEIGLQRGARRRGRARRLRRPHAGGRGARAPDLREVAETILSRPVLIATAFVAVPSVMFGAIEVLVPLRIDDLGGGHALIAAGFIAGAGLEAVLAPLAGRYSDRVGPARCPSWSGSASAPWRWWRSPSAQTLGVVWPA